MTFPRVKNYSELTDMTRPTMDLLKWMNEEELIQLIGVQAEVWNMPIPDTCGKTKKELIEVVVKMAEEVNNNNT